MSIYDIKKHVKWIKDVVRMTGEAGYDVTWPGFIKAKIMPFTIYVEWYYMGGWGVIDRSLDSLPLTCFVGFILVRALLCVCGVEQRMYV